MRIRIVFLILFFSRFSLSAQVNDLCANATKLTNLNNYCSPAGAFTTVGATDDLYPAAPCWNTAGTINDVWFSFVATAYDVNISVTGNLNGLGTLNSPQIELCSGVCGGTLNWLACGTAPAGVNTISIYKGGLIIGTTYLIRVDGLNSNTGTFNLCINNFTPPPNVSGDCITAVILCNKNTITVPKVTGPGSDPTEGKGTCIDNLLGNAESNSTWYQWTCKNSGTFDFHITPLTPGDDIDFVFYQLNPNCATKTLLRCNGSSCLGAGNLGVTGLDPLGVNPVENFNCGGLGNGNSPFCTTTTLTAGLTYVLLINNFTAANNGFTLSFGGTSTFLGPDASFTYTPTSGCIIPGTPFTFVNTSTGATVNNWTFGPFASIPTYSGVTPPAISFTAAGTYPVTLEVQSPQGCKVIYSQTITVAPAPPPPSVVSPVIYCQGDAPSPLSATGTALLWYTTPTGGTGSPTVPVPVTTTPGTTIYYVSQTIGSCESGRDSISVTVNPLPTLSITPQSICLGGSVTLTANPSIPGGAYLWMPGGATTPTITVTPSGSTTYSCTYILTGCSATASALVTIIPAPTVSVAPQTICAGQSTTLTAIPSITGGTFLWTPGGNTSQTITVSPAGTTVYKCVYNYFGCMDSTVATVTVNPVPTLSMTPQTICNGQSTTLTANPSINGGTYLWSPGGETTPTITVNPSTTTIYSCNYTLTGCTGSASATVTVNPVPTLSIAPQTICNGQSTTLTANPSINGGTYLWTPGGMTTPAITVNPSTSTIYSCTYTLAGCTGSASATVTVNPVPTLSIAPQTICNGQSTTLTAIPSSNGGTFLWSPGGATTPTITINPSITTLYSCTYSLVGCSGSASATLTVNALPTITISNSSSICEGDNIMLTAVGAASYTWSPVGIVSQAITVSPPSTTVYIVNATDINGCTGSNNVTVTVDAKPVADAGPDLAICIGATAQFKSSGVSPSWNCTWNPPDNLSRADIPNPIFIGQATTTYTMTVSDPNSICPPATAMMTVTVNPIPAVDAGCDTSIMAGNQVQLNATGGVHVQWYSTSDLSCFTCNNPVVTPLVTTTYIVVAIDANGCRNRDSVTVFVEDIITMYIPNAFTPDNDSPYNDVFHAYGFGIRDFEFYIFNRWGEMIFESYDINTGWDGSYKGKQVTEDVYAYIAKARSITGKTITRTGSVTLLRLH